jgi:uncharacterized protein YlaN (UPF0358 family)
LHEFKVLIVDDSPVYRKLLEQQMFGLESCSDSACRSPLVRPERNIFPFSLKYPAHSFVYKGR